MRIDRVALENFRCFGKRTLINLDDSVTALVGANGTGKTAAMYALLRIFGTTDDQRRVRRQDFHVPHDEPLDQPPSKRSLAVEAHLSFPELSSDAGDGQRASIPAFFDHACADDRGELRCRIRLEAEWVDDGAGGTIDPTRLDAITTFDATFADDQRIAFRGHDRSYIQMVYVPAIRNAEAQIGALLKGRLWRAINWSDRVTSELNAAAARLNEVFEREDAVKSFVKATEHRWRQVHSGNTDSDFRIRPIDLRLEQFIRNVSFYFRPDESGKDRDIDGLSDGQKSLFQLALTAAVLDIENNIAVDRAHAFRADDLVLPLLTIIAVEEPENNLAPFYLARIVDQLQELAGRKNAQAIISSHSASVMSRIQPSQVRHFRLNLKRCSQVRPITLPESPQEAAKYVREAVMRYPELYFAEFVVLGEGSSEEVVLPRIGSALGIPMDRSFIATVPLGGRHVKYLWKLLTDLGIPHATLLDLDLGRHMAGAARIKHAIGELQANGVSSEEIYSGGALTEVALDAAVRDNLGVGIELQQWLDHLQGFGVFFAAPLDLDMSMLSAFPEEYKAEFADSHGPTNRGDAIASVLGDNYQERSPALDLDYATYRYLFLGRGKPVTHVGALTRLTNSQIAANVPRELRALITHVGERVTLSNVNPVG